MKKNKADKKPKEIKERSAFKKLKKPDFSPKNIRRRMKQLVAAGIALIMLYLVFTNLSRFYIPLAIGAGLIISYVVRNMVAMNFPSKIPFYMADSVLLFLLSYFIGDRMISTLYLCILTDFYLSSKSTISNAIISVFYFISYIVILSLSKHVQPNQILSFIFNEIITFAICYVIINLCIVILDKNETIQKNLETVSERETKLKEAYQELENVTILQERNRIAKEMHDTTGHSITTIIMQTEAAKLLIDSNPEEAKRKIISANMQAISALEEMRNSVHVLSGKDSEFDLKLNLERVIAETMEGTDIVIRSKIDDEVKRVDYAAARLIYGALKEGLSNGIRHGKSNAFFFELKMTENGFSFLLSDNGTGTDRIVPGFGLKQMTEQFENIGYRVKFQSEKDEGFEISIFKNLRRGKKHD